MRVLIIGSGGREHALSWKVARSGKAEKIYCAPGNGGTAQEGENIPLKDSDVAGLVSFAKGNVIDFVIPGPELPLTLGVVDAMTQAGIRCFGPSQWCAQLEGSKAFAKDIMQKAGVPTAACGVFTELEAAKAFVEEKGAPIVIKADGLAAGTLLGNALGLGSGVAYAGVFLVNTEPEGDAMSSYFLGQVAGALIGLPFLSGETDFSFVPMVCIFALGVFQLGLSYVLIARGIATTPPMTASLVTAIEPILTPVWVALAYGERLSGFSLAGAVLVLCSVVWFNTRGRKAL